MGSFDGSDLREAILDVSLQLGSEDGADGVTMRAIARRLGVSATALYQHFDSKAAILRAVRFRGLDRMNAFLRPAFELHSPRERLIEQSRRYLQFARDNPWLYCLLMVDEDTEDWYGLEQREREIAVASRRLTIHTIEEGIRRREFKAEDLDASRSATMIWAALHGFALLVLRGRISETHPFFPVESLDALTETFVVSIVHGLVT